MKIADIEKILSFDNIEIAMIEGNCSLMNTTKATNLILALHNKELTKEKDEAYSQGHKDAFKVMGMKIPDNIKIAKL